MVHAGDADSVSVSCPREVLHATLAADRDRSPLRRLPSLLHRIPDGHSSQRCCSYGGRCFRLHHVSGLRLLWVSEVHRVEEW